MQNTEKGYALITGATEGIGYELSKLFAADGYNLILVARTEDTLQQRADELRGAHAIDVVTIPTDLSQATAPQDLYDDVKARGLTVTALVNDAGQGQFGHFVEGDLSRFKEIIQLNISALTAITHLFVQDMVARGDGKILQLASVASQLPGPWQAVYHATKAYVLSFSEAIANELKGSGVTVTALQPGATDTDFFHKADMLDSKVLDSKLSDPADVAKDGYKALMNGDDKVISGMMNKVQVGMSNVLPESVVAERVNQMQKPRTSDQ